jgi:hypothetical protein
MKLSDLKKVKPWQWVVIYVAISITYLSIKAYQFTEKISITSVSDSFPQEYADLFSPNHKSLLTLMHTYGDNLHSPTTVLIYDKRFYVIIRKINNVSFSLTEDVTIRKDEKFSTDGNYLGLEFGRVKFNYNEQLDSEIKNLCIAIQDNELVDRATDTVRYFSFRSDIIHISYNCKQACSIYIENASQFFLRYPIDQNLMFWRKNGATYFFSMFPMNDEDKLGSEELYGLIFDR